MVSKEESLFGVSLSNEPVKKYTLKNPAGVSIELLTYGATVRSITVPDREGNLADIALGYDTLLEYERGNAYFGATVGRCANRTGGSSFTLDGETFRLSKNEGENHLHGGVHGFHNAVWKSEELKDGIVMEHFSPDGDQGYPGNLHVKVSFELRETRLIIGYEAVSDRETPVNLTNHTYFNLDGHDSGSIQGHKLRIHADRYTPTDRTLIPDGRVLQVAGTPFDFLKFHRIGERISDVHEQIQIAAGYDHNFALKGDFGKLRLAAELIAPLSGRRMDTYTTMPGLQFYSGNYLSHKGKSGREYGKHGALCLETQYWPDAMNHSDFPSPILKRGDVFRHTTIYDFKIGQSERTE